MRQCSFSKGKIQAFLVRVDSGFCPFIQLFAAGEFNTEDAFAIMTCAHVATPTTAALRKGHLPAEGWT